MFKVYYSYYGSPIIHSFVFSPQDFDEKLHFFTKSKFLFSHIYIDYIMNYEGVIE